jgi:hypothetical protein
MERASSSAFSSHLVLFRAERNRAWQSVVEVRFDCGLRAPLSANAKFSTVQKTAVYKPRQLVSSRF